MTPPAFQFYPDDFLAGCLDLTPAEVGAYIRLLCVQWSRGAIKPDPDRLAMLAGGEVSDAVLEKFETGEDGLLRNARLESERAKQAEYRERQAANGRRGGRPKKATGKPEESQKEPKINPTLFSGLSETKANGNPNKSSPSPSPSPSPISTNTRPNQRRRPKDLKECLAMADRIGWDHESATQWYNDQEAAGWRDANGYEHGNWPKLMAGARDWQRDRKARNSSRGRNGAETGSGGPSEAALMIRNQKELERVEAAIKRIGDRYDYHQDMSAEDRAELRRLNQRNRELLEILEMAA